MSRTRPSRAAVALGTTGATQDSFTVSQCGTRAIIRPGPGSGFVRLLGYSRILRTLLFALVLPTTVAVAQQTPNVPQQYRRLFFQYADQRSRLEKGLNLIGKTNFPVGRSFALIAGVTQYPNFPPLERSLRPAAVDIEKLKSYLKDQIQ